MIRTLAIECSSPRGSVAILADDGILAESSWADAPRDGRRLFEAIATILREANLTAAEIDLFAAGRGPGNYSGMRVALTAAAAMALPGGRPVYAVDSGIALADEVLQEVAADDVMIAGDARRGYGWTALFHRAADGSATARTPWALMAHKDLAGHVPRGGVAATSEWERLSAAAGLVASSECPWLPRSLYPRAAVIGRRAAGLHRRGELSGPASPIYLHPPVAGSGSIA